jgi:5-methylcytosine-specific restriction endonuclease McrA
MSKQPTNKYNLSSKIMKLCSEYTGGKRTKSHKKANSLYQKAMFNDPYSLVAANATLRDASKRAVANGCVNETDPVKISDMRRFHIEVHQRNCRDGRNTWSVDHIVELWQGGSNTIDNLQIITKVENNAKHNALRVRYPDQWADRHINKQLRLLEIKLQKEGKA